ncbi:MAG: peptidylprolyl isomerase [Deltaproteobacteria bacterium]|nr:peptidylprolyl isomerase [Deltaproteobacteria bacterium]
MSKRVISFHYQLTNNDGEVLDSSKGHSPLAFIEGSQQIIPGLEKELLSLQTGDKKKVLVKAAEAYGERDNKFVISVPRDKFPPDVVVGDEFQNSEDEHSMPFKVISVNEGYVELDANHPLAGVDLTFDVELIDIRPASQEELTHGHVHGEGGHPH